MRPLQDETGKRKLVFLTQSDKDFFAKLTISYKEARETHYWIRLLTDTNYLNQVVVYPVIMVLILAETYIKKWVL